MLVVKIKNERKQVRVVLDLLIDFLVYTKVSGIIGYNQSLYQKIIV